MSNKQIVSNIFLEKLLSDNNHDEIDRLIESMPFIEKKEYHFTNHYSSLIKRGEIKKACIVLENGILKNPNSIKLRIFHAEHAMLTSDFCSAIGRWDYITNHFNGFQEGVRWRRARAYLLNHQFEDARKEINTIVSRKGENQKSSNLLDIINSEQAKKYLVEIKRENAAGVFVLGNKKPGVLKLESIKNYRIKGWIKTTFDKPASLIVKNKNGTRVYDLNNDRLDVKRHFNKKGEDTLIKCGYDYIIDVSSETEIGFLVNNTKYWVISIKAKKVLDVLRGLDNWLFLANDANSSIDQYTGKKNLSERNIKEWSDFSKNILKYQNKTEFLYIIANSKEKVFPEYYPFKMAKKTITDMIEDIFIENKINYLNPVDNLKKNKYSYYKTDTHWSDLGAYIAYRATMDKILDLNFMEKVDFIDSEVVGDLGSKLTHPEKSIKKTFVQPPELLGSQKFFNGISGTGYIKIFMNEKASTNKTVLIFGGSSMANFAKYFNYSFRRVVTINLPGSIVGEIIDFENPDLLLVQTNERYLISPGKCFDKFHESPLSKALSAKKPIEKNNILKSINNSNSEYFYRDLSLEALGSF